MSENPEFRKEPVSFWNEFRAIFTRPAKLFDSEEDRARGYIEHRTDWFKSPVEARNAAIKNSEETLAVYQGMEMSWVTRSEPERVSL